MNQILYSKRSRKKPFAGILILLLVLIAGVLVGVGYYNTQSDKILKGVIVANADVSNLTKDEAMQRLNEIYSQIDNASIVLKYNDIECPISGEDIGYSYTSVEEVVEKAYEVGRNGNFIQNNIVVIKSYLNEEVKIDIEKIIDEQKLLTIAEKILSGESNTLSDDKYEVSKDKLILTKGTQGKAIDKEALKTNVVKALEENNTYAEVPIIVANPKPIDLDAIYAEIAIEAKDASYKEENNFEIIPEQNGIDFDKEDAKVRFAELEEGKSLEVKLNITYPKVTIKTLGETIFKDLLATHTSKYDTSIKNRVTNLQIAAKKCNDTILLPGEEFSFNKALGHRTTANGYKSADSFAGGKVVQSVGGGICQMSSTLYNSALKAGLKITSRTAHGMYVEYVEQSTDATVVDNAIDFKFQNNRKYPIKIVTSCQNGVMTASIYGIKEAEEPTYKIEVKVLSETKFGSTKQYDANLEEGKTRLIHKGVNGYKSEAYRVTYSGDKEISRELLSKDSYSPIDEIIVIGTKKVEVTPVEPITPPEVKPQDPGILLPPGWDSPESGY